jgi:dynamin family protein
MSEFERLRDDVLVFYLRLLATIGPRLAETRRRMAQEWRDRLAEGRYYVVVCGEFRRGKSSLLNALVERPGLFPVDVDITTCAVTILHWDSQEAAVVYFAETSLDDPSSAAPPERITLDRIEEFATEQGNPDNDKLVERIEIGAPIPQLEPGLVLVDTPGLGSVNPGHNAATRAYLPRADAVLFVSSATQPLSESELGFLREALAKRPVVVAAVTMIDKVVNAAPVVAEARDRIAAEAAIAADDLVLVPVSALRKQQALEEHDPARLARSGFPELETEIWEGLAATCGAARIQLSLTEWSKALAEVSAPVDNDLAALRGDAAKAAAQLRERQDAYRKLVADSHTWRRDLLTDIRAAARPIQNELDDRLNDIYFGFRDALQASDAETRAPALIEQAPGAMVDAANRAVDALEGELTVIAERYTARTELSIAISEAPQAAIGSALAMSAPNVQAKPQSYSRFREMWLGASAFAGAGALIGAVGGFVGSAVGGVVGFFVGLFAGRGYQRRRAEEQRRLEYIADLRDRVLPKIEASKRRLAQNVAEQVQNYGQQLTAELEDELRAKGDSLAASIRAMEDTQRQDAKGRAEKERLLAGLQRELTALATELQALSTRTDALSRRRSGRPQPA